MFDRMKNRIDTATSPTREHWSELGSDFKSRLTHMTQNREIPQGELDFQRVLAAWGMTEKDIPHVLKAFKIRVGVFLMLLLPGIILLFQGMPLYSLCFSVVGIVGSLGTLWRIRILQKRHFRPLFRLVRKERP